MTATILQGNCLDVLRDSIEPGTIQTCVTSPPYYGLRDYGIDGQLGLEKTPEEYVSRLVEIFREVRNVLKDDGTFWLNLGDSYAGSWGNYGGQNRGNGKQREIVNGSKVEQKAYEGKENWKPPTANNLGNGIKPKDLIGIPWMVAFALRADGWYLRQDIIWNKPNPMPESVKDRCTKAHEYIFLLTKSAKYYCDMDAIAEPANYDGVRIRNKRSVWTVTTKPYKGAHFATFPPDLIEPCILAGSRVGNIVLDPFNGSGTTGEVAIADGRNYVGIELNPAYIDLTNDRLAKVQLRMDEVLGVK